MSERAPTPPPIPEPYWSQIQAIFPTPEQRETVAAMYRMGLAHGELQAVLRERKSQPEQES